MKTALIITVIVIVLLMAAAAYAACVTAGVYDDMNGLNDDVQWENRTKEK